ncbi:hypothetical protein D3C72_706480 [compost metagenome]
MPAKSQPGNGLAAEWNLGESGYKDGMDANLRFLSAAVQLVLERSDATLPTPPAEGMLAIAENGATIVGYKDGAWISVAIPRNGWVGYDKLLGTHIHFDGSAWGRPPWIEDAPVNGRRYIRKDGAWLEDDYRISAFIPQITQANQQVASFIIPVPMSLPNDVVDCVVRCQLPPPEEVALILRKNTTQIGTITFTPGETVGVIDITGTADVEFAKHDELNVFAPSPITGVPEGIRILFRLEM